MDADVPVAQPEHISLLNSGDVTIHSSPLKRASSYALVLADQHDLDVNIDPRISEINFGDWEMRSWDDIGAEELDLWIASGYDSIHGGDSLTEFDTRIHEWFNSLSPHIRHVVVTHAGVIRSIARTVYGMSLDESLKLSIDFGEAKKF